MGEPLPPPTELGCSGVVFWSSGRVSCLTKLIGAARGTPGLITTGVCGRRIEVDGGGDIEPCLDLSRLGQLDVSGRLDLFGLVDLLSGLLDVLSRLQDLLSGLLDLLSGLLEFLSLLLDGSFAYLIAFSNEECEEIEDVSLGLSKAVEDVSGLFCKEVN